MTAKITTRKLIKYNQQLCKRDKEVLQSLKICEYMKTNQIKRLHFSGSTPTVTTRTLNRVYKLGLVKPLERRIGGVRAGSSSYVWALTMAGVELLHLNNHESPAKSRKRVYEPSYIFLNHTLAISELYSRLYTTTATNLMKSEFEPHCWRVYSSHFGVNATLKPDLYAVTATSGFEDYWFFEVDLDTEAPTRIIRKCESYVRYFRTGQEQKRSGVFPRVAWVVPDDKRKITLKKHIDENLSDYADLFAVIVFEELDTLLMNIHLIE
jgi:hypothetical protein